ncbi:MAG: PEGA domain-containing protein [Myxococcota bacterium]
MLPLVLVVLAAPAPSSAPARPSLPSRAAVFVVGADREKAAAADQLEAKLTRALDDAKVELTDLESLFPLPAVDDTGAKAFAEAKKGFDDLDYEPALANAHKALEAFTAHPESATAAELADVHFFIGAVSMQLSGKAAAKKAQEFFARALLYNPDLQLNAELYGNEAKKAFEKAKQEVSGRGMGPLTITSTPAGAQVLLRDKSLGLTPLAEPPSVLAGRHLVKLSRPGFAPFGAFADVSSGGATVEATLSAAPGYAEAREVATTLLTNGVGSGKVPPTARKLGEVMKARFLVVAVKRGDDSPLEVWDVETGNRLGDVTLSDDASLATAATRVKDFVDHPSPLAPVAATVEQGGGDPVYKKWWFWTAVGVVVVGSATAVGVAAASSKPGYNVVLGTP